MHGVLASGRHVHGLPARAHGEFDWVYSHGKLHCQCQCVLLSTLTIVAALMMGGEEEEPTEAQKVSTQRDDQHLQMNAGEGCDVRVDGERRPSAKPATNIVQCHTCCMRL